MSRTFEETRAKIEGAVAGARGIVAVRDVRAMALTFGADPTCDAGREWVRLYLENMDDFVARLEALSASFTPKVFEDLRALCTEAASRESERA